MISVYDVGNTNYDGNGDAVLTPTECTIRQVAAGNYDLTMKHPLDPDGAWQHILPGAVIKAPIPEEEIENAYAGYAADVYKTTTKAELREGPTAPTTITYPTWSISTMYAVGAKVSWQGQNYQCTYFDETSIYATIAPPSCGWWKKIPNGTTGAAVLVSLAEGTELYFVQDYDSTWYKMATYYGIEGYILKTQVTFYKHLEPSETKPRIITEQLFRIGKPVIDSKGTEVSVTAKHVSYDLSGIIVKDVQLSQASPNMALGRIVEGFMIDYQGTIATNLQASENGTMTETFKGKNGIFTLLDPDKGVVSKFDAAYKRDNWDLFVMKKVETDRGYAIEYAENMLGVNWSRDMDSLVTRIVPVAKDEEGNDLYLPETWVDSTRINDYPVIKMEMLSVKGQVGKDKGLGDDSVWTEADLLDEMRAKAEERYSIDKVDQVIEEIAVDFEQLGDTWEYRERKGTDADKILLYDTVTVTNPIIGLSKKLYVTELEWDAIRLKVSAVKLSNTLSKGGRNVTGYNVQSKSIGADKLTDDVASDIVKEVKDIIPTYSDQTGSSGSRLNTKDYAGFVQKGDGQANKVWATDDQGNPDWRSAGGDIVTGTASGSVSVGSETVTNIGSITLTKGKWVIVACCDWAANANGSRQLSFANSINPSRNLAVTTPSAGSQKETYQHAIRLHSTNGETMNCYAWQDSGSAITAYPYIYAIKISE